ncbi:Peptidyl-prolyl cis-trans isomerase cyp15 [Rhizina undulata]
MSDEDTAMRESTPRSIKRSRTDSDPAPPATKDASEKATSAAPEDDDTSSDDDIGPMLPPAPGTIKKKRRVLPHERLYLSALPSSPKYSKSLMHRDNLAFVTMTPLTDFLITTSVDGVVKFWKKVAVGIEFVKMFRAHQGEIVSVSVSSDGRSFASAGVDKKVAIFDVVTFELLTTITLSHPPKSTCWVHKRGSSLPLLAIADTINPEINIYDGRGSNVAKPLYVVQNLHRNVVHLMAFNDKYDCVISCDESGMVEYWSPRPERDFEKPDNVFKFKSDTGLFEFKKSKSIPTSLTISPTSESFATFSAPDRQVRVFDFPSGRLHRKYDESLTTITTMQQAASQNSKLSDLEFGRRLAVESDLSNPASNPENSTSPSHSALSKQNILFDESGHFIIYGSLTGIKVLNTVTNKLIRQYGKEESFRPLHLALYQGAPLKKSLITVEMAASSNPLLEEAEARDPMLFATGHHKGRFYMFTNDSSASKSERDIFNEKPTKDQVAGTSKDVEREVKESGNAAVIHTTYGDIHIRLFPDAAPKTVENFVTHSKNGYYNGTIFHRVIRKFMIQCGDPLGDGTGGESIWGGEFEDEFSSLKHDKPYTVSMANAGPNTNASQFFITTEKTPWLDNIHTIFGRAIQGLDVIHKIENTRVFKEKPEEDIKIINISIL